jgi:primosomal protein N' (replication factor Y)
VSCQILKIALDTPLDTAFDYRWVNPSDTEDLPKVGQFALVPFGRREVIGLILSVHTSTDVPADKLRDVIAVRSQLSPLSAAWIELCRFAAEYYQRPVGEVVIPSCPKNLRVIKPTALDKALKKIAAMAPATSLSAASPLELNTEQQQVVEALSAETGFKTSLLFGVTGSGKTEVYLQSADRILRRSIQTGEPAQILIMVPEINLTPQLETNIRNRFPDLHIATMHSQLAEGERMQQWLAAHSGKASIVLGTRLSVLASMPYLKLIVVDEEHDPSYKQQDGLRYSARDLAVWRARQLDIPIVLGSATPSVESWQHAATGRYRKLALTHRAAINASLPAVGLIDMERNKAPDGLSAPLIAAIKLRLEKGEQSLLFLNRRGYAPVINCDACGWISNCRRCTAFMVLHKPERRLRCHHCSAETRIPSACPTCGNVDLQPLGRGTQKIEETLQQLFPAARILRIDADSTRKKGSAQIAFDSVHRGDVDILLGTQMVAKGHDFQRLTLVGVINPDTALFSQDYRAGERLFAQLMQVAGRAGRAAKKAEGNASEVLIQTRYPAHPLYRALLQHDYPGFAETTLKERRDAGLPPFIFQALLRAEARELQKALDFLELARHLLADDSITLNDPVPMNIVRVAGVERAQLLIECASRAQLQAFLKPWVESLRKMKSRIRWSLEVDPVDI